MSQSCCFHVFSCPGCWHSLSHSLVPHMPQAGQAFGNAPKKPALPAPRSWDRTGKLGHTEESPDCPNLCVNYQGWGGGDWKQGFGFDLLPTARICQRGEQQQVPLPRVCPAGEFFLSWLKYSRKTSDFHHTFSKCAVAPRGKGDV